MTTIPAFAPGCFGSALAFQKDHSICRDCKFSAECEPLHNENIKRLREELGIERRSTMGSTAHPASRNVALAGSTLPKKVDEIVARIQAMGLDIAGKMRNGENPFSAGNAKFLRVGALIFLRADFSVTTDLLSRLYVRKLECKANTAEAYARMALQIFDHFGAIEKSDGGYRIRRN